MDEDAMELRCVAEAIPVALLDLPGLVGIDRD